MIVSSRRRIPARNSFALNNHTIDRFKAQDANIPTEVLLTTAATSPACRAGIPCPPQSRRPARSPTRDSSKSDVEPPVLRTPCCGQETIWLSRRASESFEAGITSSDAHLRDGLVTTARKARLRDPPCGWAPIMVGESGVRLEAQCLSEPYDRLRSAG